MALERASSDVLPRAGSGVRGDEAYWRYSLSQCREQRWRQQRQYLSFASAADWQQHCDDVRARFRASLGPLPERTPLNPQVTGRLERDGYTVEKLLLESQPGFYITANLYLPAPGRFPAPAILNPVGHWPHGKAEDLVQARGIGLARHGYVALIYDQVGQGERSQERDSVQQRNSQPAATLTRSRNWPLLPNGCQHRITEEALTGSLGGPTADEGAVREQDAGDVDRWIGPDHGAGGPGVTKGGGGSQFSAAVGTLRAFHLPSDAPGNCRARDR